MDFNDKTAVLLLSKRDYRKLRSIPELTQSSKEWVCKVGSLMESIEKKLFHVPHWILLNRKQVFEIMSVQLCD